MLFFPLIFFANSFDNSAGVLKLVLKCLPQLSVVKFSSLSFSKSPDFYEFIRTLETYEKVLDKKTTLVLPGDSKLLKELTQ